MRHDLFADLAHVAASIAKVFKLTRFTTKYMPRYVKRIKKYYGRSLTYLGRAYSKQSETNNLAKPHYLLIEENCYQHALATLLCKLRAWRTPVSRGRVRLTFNFVQAQDNAY